MDGGVNAMKEMIGKFEERSNDQKEECLFLLFCMEESDRIRVLGSWVGTKEDVNEYKVAKSGRSVGESERADEEYEVV